jgi:hypothetical protein
MAGYPSGLDRLMEFALSSLPMVTGINLEALGLANREQAGVLEQQRKQAAFGLLAPMFDSLRRYRKNQGRIQLFFIHEFISDGRLIRIGGPDSQQFLPLLKQDKAITYDLIVDVSPNAPDTKQQTWEALTTIVPNMMKAGMPIPPDLLDFAPIPTALATKWKAFLQQQPQQDPRTQQVLQENEKLQQQVQQLTAQQQSKQGELQQRAAETQQELDIKRQTAQEELRLKREQAMAEFQLEEEKMQREFELEARRLNHEASIKSQQARNDFKVKSMAAGLKPKKDAEGNDSLSISMDTGDLKDAIKAMHEHTKASHEAMLKAVSSLADAVSRPRKLITDAKGKPIGSTLS